ncbi:hypothetical protein E2I00_009569, partial [Balaenoptera physalus]
SGGLLKALCSDSYVKLSQYQDQHFQGDKQIYELFSKSGDIKKIIMGLDKMKKTARGFSFVEHYSRADTENAMWYINGTRCWERRLWKTGPKPVSGESPIMKNSLLWPIEFDVRYPRSANLPIFTKL